MPAYAKVQGSAAGPRMLGTTLPFDRLPYFYSDQYDLSMEYTGRASDPSDGESQRCPHAIRRCYHLTMPSTRTSFTLDRDLAERARRLKVNVSAAARQGVEAAVRSAMAHADRDAYRRRPERPDRFWADVEAWSEG